MFKSVQMFAGTSLMADNLERVRGALHVLCERLRVTAPSAAGH